MKSSRQLFASCANAIACGFLSLALPAYAASTASDVASNSTYNSGWTSGMNGGTGFGAWVLTAAASGGHFVGSSASNAGGSSGDIDTASRAWGMWATNGVSQAVRPLTGGSLAVGQVLKVSLDNGYITTGRSVGMDLQNSAGSNLFEFGFTGGDPSYFVSDRSGVRTISLPYTGDGLTIEFELRTNNAWLARIITGSGVHYVSGYLANQTDRGIARLRFWNWEAGADSNYDFFLNSLSVSTGTLATHTDGAILITEFMAKNDKTLTDGDGNNSDWIELYNASTNDINLTGWYLSDDETDPLKWSFPLTVIPADSYLVVFASGQDDDYYMDSLGYLHTTFKLSGDGESIVLTRPDGVTTQYVVSNYPEQFEDISYGLEQDSSSTYIIAENESAKALIPSSEPAASWNTVSFSDSSWLSGSTGVGFEDSGSTYGSMINLDVSDMFPGTLTCYIRVPFTVTDPSAISLLTLRMKYDDGFVAYINGTQVASANAPSSPGYGSQANGEHTGTSYEDFSLSNPSAYLQAGENVLAIHALDYPSGTPDLFIMPVLNGAVGGELLTNSVRYLTTPTPGADNVAGVLGYVSDTSFSVDRGFYTNAFAVEISCKTDGAQIYYTMDGTAPSAINGTLYTNALTISKTTVLRATATKTGYQSSDTDSQTYIFLDDIIAQGTSVSGLAPYFPASAVNGQDFDYGMDPDIVNSATYSGQMKGALLAIPSISIVTDPDNLFNASSGIYVNADEEGEAWERETSVELINPDGTKGFQINGGMRIRGESSTMASNPKHSFRFIFDSEYGTSRLTYPLFGDEGADSFKRMDLRTGQNFSWANQTPQYATWLYDIFTRDTHRDMGQPYTRGEYYHLYINGMYWGLYQTEERCDSRFAESYYGGDNDDFDAVKADGDTGDMYAVDGTRDAYESLWSGLSAGVSGNAAYFALQGMNTNGTENGSYTKLLDVDNIIDYMLLVYFTANRDSPIGPPNQNNMPRNVTSIYNRADPDGFKFVAHDNEHTLEITEGVSHNRFNQTLSSSFDGIDRMTPWWMHVKLMNNAEYKLRFADHVHEHFFNNGTLTATNAANRLTARRDEIYAAVVAESARWGDSKSTTPRTRDGDWLTSVNWLLNSYFLASPSTRSAIVYGQIVTKGWYPTVAAPEFNQHGGSIASGFSLSISGSGTIYYTTDGSDPRAVGGSAVGTAGTSIVLTKSTQVKARVLSGGAWSALTKATFVVNEASPLRVTEIMYHPADPTTGVETNYSSSDFEFIEILNTSDEVVGLAGTEFSRGIRFDFTEGDESTLDPGEYAILASNYGAFTNRYTNWANIKIAGQYHGKFFIPTATLDDGGEGITLVDGLGNTILDFEYNDWYDITDGDGYSLTLIDPDADTSTWSESSSWRPSKYMGGTPGYGPYEFLSPADLVINEALSHQDQDNPGDWIELYNGSTNTISINGWYLSDDAADLQQLQLSGLPLIAAGSYLVLTEYAHFGTNVAGTNGFALSELGDSIYLSSGEGGELTGYRLEEDADVGDRSVTFGRYVKSDGDTDFPAMETVTYGASNSYPKVGPVVISEIMYHPADSNTYEFIELHNTASTNISFFDPAHPTNTWMLSNAVEFEFPEGFILSAGGYVIVTETNAAAFTNAYSVPAGVTVLGPYDGKLDNGGESVQLRRPGEPEVLTGEVPYILVEKVQYDDESPWPTGADGNGYSLRRLDEEAYANDSVNWSRSSGGPTPGSGDTALVADYDQMAVAGSFNSWNTSASNMTLVDNHTWQWTTTFTNQGSVLFKFAAAGGWDVNWGDDNPTGQSLPLDGIGESYGANIAAGGTLDGLYVFTFNERTLAYSLEGGQSNPDADGDGMPDDWERDHFGSTDALNGGAYEDWDGDGAVNIYEWYAGTIPIDETSVFRIVSLTAAADYVVSWSSETGKTYSLWVCTNLPSGGFTRSTTGIAETSPMNVYTVGVDAAECLFFRLSVDRE